MVAFLSFPNGRVPLSSWLFWGLFIFSAHGAGNLRSNAGKKVRQYTRFQFDTAPRRILPRIFFDQSFCYDNFPAGTRMGRRRQRVRWRMPSANYQQVELKIELYDGQGALLGETLDYTRSWGPT